MSSRRRTFLELLGGAGIAGLAGCTGSGEETGTPSPTSNPTPTGITATETETATETATETETETATPTQEPMQGALVGTLPTDAIDSGEIFGEEVALSTHGRTALVAAPPAHDSDESETGSAYVFGRSDATWSQQGRLAPDDRKADRLFGDAAELAADGGTAIVAATPDLSSGAVDGTAYVFERSGGNWNQQGALSADDGEPGDYFGVSVALADDGTTAIVGAEGADLGDVTSAGAVYAFERSGGEWGQQKKLTLRDPVEQNNFGQDVALGGGGTTLLVGADEDVDDESSAGAAYVFEQSGGTWDRQAKLTADDGDGWDLFGWNLALSADGTTALVGALDDEDPNGEDDDVYLFGGAGSAYVFQRTGDGWSQESKLVPDDGDAADNFGKGVALGSDGDLALVSAPGDEDPNGDGAGSAYLFRRSGHEWDQQAKLAADDGASGDMLGWTAAASRDGTTGLLAALGSDVYVVD